MQLLENDYRSTLSSKQSISRNSSTTSISSKILYICPLSLDENNYSSKLDNEPKTKRSSTTHLSVNTTLYNIRKKCNSLNQLDKYLQCHQSRSEPTSLGVTSFEKKSDNQKATLQPVEIEKSLNKDKKILVKNNTTTDGAGLSQADSKKQFNHNNRMRLLSSSETQESYTRLFTNSSSSSSQSCLFQPGFQPSLASTEGPVETVKCLPLASACEPVLKYIYLSPKDIDYYKKRQNELHHTVQVLIERLKIQTNENINQISKYWSYLKQLCLNGIQPQTSFNQLCNYLIKPINSNKQFEYYLKQNDEIGGLLQIMSNTLHGVQYRYSSSTINRLFDCEEEMMIDNLRSELEFLLSSYFDTLTIINEFSSFSQTSLQEVNNFHLREIIKNDYPSLVEKISNDFITKVPQVDQMLVKMLRNIKKHLFCDNFDVVNKSDI
ncbi:unnamed protein product [Rotaria sp. Silwood1]|nr:unnamed protein product [Rotaria sp. Silwood1]CAF1184668.1 unnamed protein product [Rotaria sp. Silwood1]